CARGVLARALQGDRPGGFVCVWPLLCRGGGGRVGVAAGPLACLDGLGGQVPGRVIGGWVKTEVRACQPPEVLQSLVQPVFQGPSLLGAAGHQGLLVGQVSLGPGAEGDLQSEVLDPCHRSTSQTRTSVRGVRTYVKYWEPVPVQKKGWGP